VSDDVARCLGGAYVDSFENWSEESDRIQASDPISILVADDIVTNQLILKSLLEEAGHSVMVVSNGEELIDALGPQLRLRPNRSGDRTFDLVLTDVQMPRMDGVAATLRIREAERSGGITPQGELPVIAVTAHAFPEERERILAAGATAVITKPIEPKQLEAALATCRPKAEEAPRPAAPTMEARPEPPAASPQPLPPLPLSAPAEELAEIIRQAEAVCELARPVIDLPGVYERSGESPRRCLLIFRAFLAGYEQVVRELEVATQSMAQAEVRRTAHALKGMLLEAGAVDVSRVAKEVEILAKEEQLEEALQRAPELAAKVTAVAQILQRVVDESAAAQAKP
jgi:CheY-like chemotaxis protein